MIRPATAPARWPGLVTAFRQGCDAVFAAALPRHRLRQARAQALTEAGIPWQIIPGVTAASAAAAAAHSFLTERGMTEPVVFATGHRRAGDVTDWSGCAAPGTTLACHMGLAGVAEMQRGLSACQTKVDTGFV